MFDLKKTKSFDEILKDISFNTGIKTNQNTFDYKIIESAYEYFDFVNSINNNMINAYTFSGKTGYELDEQFNNMGIFRFQGSKIESCNFYFTIKNVSITFLEESVFKYKDDYYKIVNIANFNPDKLSSFTAYKDAEEIQFKEPTLFGDFVFEKENIKHSSDFELQFILNNYFKFVDVKDEPTSFESDAEYKSRANKILQNLGSTNKEKIKNYMLKDVRLKDLIIKEKPGYCDILLYPYDINDMDSLYDCLDEVSEYFTLEINKIRPNLVKIIVSGVDDDGTISSFLENQVKKLSSELKLDSSSFIISLKNFINSKGFEYSNLNVKLEYYIGGTYDKPAYNKVISEEVINFSEENIFNSEVL